MAEAAEAKSAFGVARDFRRTHGEAAFSLLATTAFADSDTDGSGSIDKSELRATLHPEPASRGETAGSIYLWPHMCDAMEAVGLM